MSRADSEPAAGWVVKCGTKVERRGERKATCRGDFSLLASLNREIQLFSYGPAKEIMPPSIRRYSQEEKRGASGVSAAPFSPGECSKCTLLSTSK